MRYQIYKSPLKEILIENYIKDYVSCLNNVMSELRNVRAMQAGIKPFSKVQSQVLQNMQPLKYTGKHVKLDGVTYKEIWLPKDEYAPVEHAVSTYAKQNKIKNVVETIVYPNELEQTYYVYTIVLDKNSTPIIVGKEISK